MKFAACLAFVLVSLSGTVFAEGGRFIPRGEDNPQIVESVFRAPAGEVQVLKARNGEVSAVLRASTGGLAKLQAVNGASRCDSALKDGNVMNASCTLHFKKDSDGSSVQVDTRELENSSLFGLVKSTLKGMHGAL